MQYSACGGWFPFCRYFRSRNELWLLSVEFSMYNMKSWGNAIKGEFQKLAELSRRCWWKSDDFVCIRILPSSGMCLPRDSTAGRIGRTIGPIQRNLMVLLELSVLSVWACMCFHVETSLFATCMWISTVAHVCPGGQTLFLLQMNFNLKKWSFVSCSNSFGCGFLSECFFPSGRCVVVGGSCRMEEHSLLSDSPCSWHLRYPMSLFTDNVFISICFMCN